MYNIVFVSRSGLSTLGCSASAAALCSCSVRFSTSRCWLVTIWWRLALSQTTSRFSTSGHLVDFGGSPPGWMDRFRLVARFVFFLGLLEAKVQLLICYYVDRSATTEPTSLVIDLLPLAMCSGYEKSY